MTFDEPIGCWNTESVVNMRDLFRDADAAAFDQDIGGGDGTSRRSNILVVRLFRDAAAEPAEIRTAPPD